MSPEERRTWISAVVGVVVPIAYLVTMLSRVPSTGVASTTYVGPMLASIAIGMVAGIVMAALSRR
jgi:hypothetical protein